ncbi:MAG: metallopeptidase TldD-related protein, partial [Pseudomonadota bacterium]
FEANVEDAVNQLSHMRLPTQEVKRGNYKTYLAPAAVNELFGLLNWGGWSAQAFKTGRSPLKDLAEGKRKFSGKMNISEDFSLGLSPRFNSFGEVASDKLSIVSSGQLETLLVSSKTAEEHAELTSNQASAGEGLRSPVMGSGGLKRADILTELGTGLYLSNLHYLNYSDLPKARVTGMTRFACFWVENGEIKGPIKDLRFDETVYNIFGDNLVDITDFAEIQPVVGTYEQRAIGGAKVPGLLVNDFAYTL